jgi:hypothetical protein
MWTTATVTFVVVALSLAAIVMLSGLLISKRSRNLPPLTESNNHKVNPANDKLEITVFDESGCLSGRVLMRSRSGNANRPSGFHSANRIRKRPRWFPSGVFCYPSPMIAFMAAVMT